jgi:hypothetical protein
VNLVTVLRAPTPIATYSYSIVPQNNPLANLLNYFHALILKIFACNLVWICLCIKSCQTKVTRIFIISNMP